MLIKVFGKGSRIVQSCCYWGVLPVQLLSNEHTVCLFEWFVIIQHNSSTICEHTSKTASAYTDTYPTTRLPTVPHDSYKEFAWGREASAFTGKPPCDDSVNPERITDHPHSHIVTPTWAWIMSIWLNSMDSDRTAVRTALCCGVGQKQCINLFSLRSERPWGLLNCLENMLNI